MNMKKFFFTALPFVFAVAAHAQPAGEQQAVKSLCGCYEVEFKYAETFAADEEYKFKPRYRAMGLEWVVPEEASGKKFVFQHLLVINDTMIIKHWREDWEYEKSNWLQFTHDASWKPVAGRPQDVKGQWTQTVWEVDDAPRYQGSSKWVRTDGKLFWENTADAPLPRREYTKRNDYNVLQRTNRIVITDTGWVHEQDNKKIRRADGIPDEYIAEEKGYNIYRKVDDSRCRQAAAWWEKHRDFWQAVRRGWDEALGERNDVHLLAKVNDKRLGEELDNLEAMTLPSTELKKRIEKAIRSYIQNPPAAALKK